MAGRDFTDHDDAAAPRVVIVSEAMALRYWHTRDVLGRRFRLGEDTGPAVEIVGVARDTKVRTPGESPRPFLYVPFGQEFSNAMSIVVATRGQPGPVLAAARRELESLDARVPVFDARTMADHLRVMLFVPQMGAALLSLFGLLAMSLALLGLYGVIAFTVSQRTRELGIRIALGARSGQVVAMVLREGLALVGIGGAVGLLLAAATSGPLSRVLNGVPAFDPVAFAGVTLLFGGVAVIASWIPGRRAARVEPVVALKHD